MSRLLTGFVAGVLVVIMFAPDKGSETRKKISKRGKELKSKFNEFVDSMSEKFHSMKGEAEEFVERGRQKAQSFANEAESSWPNQ